MNGSCSEEGRRRPASGACQGVRALPQITIGKVTYTIDLRLREIRCLTQEGLRFFPLSNTYAEVIEYALRSNDRRLLKMTVKEILEQGGSGPPFARR